MTGPPELVVPPAARDGVRWLATATAAILIASVAVALRGDGGARPVPLLLAGAALVALGAVLERPGRARRRGPLPGTLIVIGAGALLLAGEAFLRPHGAALDGFLGLSGALFVALGLVRDDRRPMVIGVAQWATALGRPAGESFRHCLIATDVRIPLPRPEAVIVLGLVCLLVAVAMRRRTVRVESARGLETIGLALFLGALALKALELPGHPLLCGTGDAIDLGWALLLLAAASVIGVLGVFWSDRLWASSGLATATLFGLAAVTLEANPLWGVLVGAPLLGILVFLEHAGIDWPQRTSAPLARRPTSLPREEP
jgi:hypothetical protein